jgi:hypothetical protein
MKLWFCRQIFEKFMNIKFHKNLFIGSRVVSCRWTDGRTDMTKLIVAFRCFAKAPKNYTRKFFGHVISTHRPLYRLHLKRVYSVSIGAYSPMGLYSETYHSRFLRDSSRFIFHKYSSYFFQVLHKGDSWHNVVKCLNINLNVGTTARNVFPKTRIYPWVTASGLTCCKSRNGRWMHLL